MDVQERLLINRLIIGVSNNKENDLEYLFNITKNQLYALAKEYVDDSIIINEILSQGYLEIYRKSRSFDPHENDGFDWMCEIVKELSLKFQKKCLKKH